MAKITISLCACLGFLLVFVSVGETRPGAGKQCCTKFYTEPLLPQRLCGFSVDRTCRLNAVKFFTVRNRTVCADLKQQWVQEAMELIIKSKTIAGETVAICSINRK